MLANLIDMFNTAHIMKCSKSNYPTPSLEDKTSSQIEIEDAN